MHEMRLYDKPFNSILNERKTIEIRIYDEKRRKIKVGDIIKFTNLENGNTLKVKIINLHIFNNFEELFSKFDKKLLGYSDSEIANPKDMLKYYTEEDEKKYGVVGIEIKLLKGDR